MIDVRQLSHAAALAKFGNYRRAAQALFITQPALTKSIQNLERELDVRLFERRADGVTPTEFGAAIVAAAARILPQIDDIENEMELLKGLGKGRLNVGCDPFFAEAYMAPVLGSLLARHPSLRIRAEVIAWDVILELLLERKLDVVIGVPTENLDSSLGFIKINGFPEITYFCRPGHPLLGRGPIAPRELTPFPTVGIKTHPWWLKWFAESIDEAVESEAVTHRHFVQCDNMSVIMTIVKSSDAISGAASDVVEKDIAAGRLRRLPLILPPYPPLSFGLAYPRERIMAPAARALIDELVALAQSLGWAVDAQGSRT